MKKRPRWDINIIYIIGALQKSLCKDLGSLLGPWPSDRQNLFGNVLEKELIRGIHY